MKGPVSVDYIGCLFLPGVLPYHYVRDQDTPGDVDTLVSRMNLGGTLVHGWICILINASDLQLHIHCISVFGLLQS